MTKSAEKSIFHLKFDTGHCLEITQCLFVNDRYRISNGKWNSSYIS